MSIMFYLLAAFAVWDINIFNSAEDWRVLDRIFFGLIFIVFIISDVLVASNRMKGKKK